MFVFTSSHNFITVVWSIVRSVDKISRNKNKIPQKKKKVEKKILLLKHLSNIC